MADQFLASFDPTCQHFDPAVLQKFQDAALGCEAFRLNLLEPVARSVHSIGVSIHHGALKLHSPESIEVATLYQDEAYTDLVSIPPRANIFHHYKYIAHEQYPHGTSDMAGYWLEDRIFGGVVLFDRGESGNQTNSAWLHSSREGWTWRVWKVLDWQLDAMMHFFAHGSKRDFPVPTQSVETLLSYAGQNEISPHRMSQFPFFCDVDNPDRHDDWDAMALHHIYRDSWERKLPFEKHIRNTRDTFNYPELRDFMRRITVMSLAKPKYRIVAPSPDPATGRRYPFDIKIERLNSAEYLRDEYDGENYTVREARDED